MSLLSNVQNLNRKIFVDGQQQMPLIHLGQMALSGIALAELLSTSAALIAQTLAVDYVLIWALDPNKKDVSMQAGIGWKDGSTIRTQKPFELNSLESFTLISQSPIIIENLQGETRFNALNVLLDHGLVSGVSIPVGTGEKYLGVIEVFSRQPRVFSQEDCFFLQSVANILGLAIDRKHRESFLLNENRHLKNQLAKVRSRSIAQSERHDWDKDEIKNRLIESREKERLRLAQELHDVPIQDLYGLMYQMDDLKEYLSSPEGDEILDEYNHVLHRIVNNLRDICRDLRPPSLSAFGLEVAIRDHVEKFRDHNPNIAIHLHLMGDHQELSDSLRLNLFRIYQQAMNNVARHSEATEVHIRFGWDAKTVILEVEDNGMGFEVPKFWVELVRNDHFGLVGLAERVESIRGKLEIVSTPGNGTLVRTIVPRQ